MFHLKRGKDDKNMNVEEENSQEKSSVNSNKILQSSKQKIKSTNIPLVSPHDTETEHSHVYDEGKYNIYEQKLGETIK